jgi:hypothetical protein
LLKSSIENIKLANILINKLISFISPNKLSETNDDQHLPHLDHENPEVDTHNGDNENTVVDTHDGELVEDSNPGVAIPIPSTATTSTNALTDTTAQIDQVDDTLRLLSPKYPYFIDGFKENLNTKLPVKLTTIITNAINQDEHLFDKIIRKKVHLECANSTDTKRISSILKLNSFNVTDFIKADKLFTEEFCNTNALLSSFDSKLYKLQQNFRTSIINLSANCLQQNVELLERTVAAKRTTNAILTLTYNECSKLIKLHNNNIVLNEVNYMHFNEIANTCVHRYERLKTQHIENLKLQQNKKPASNNNNHHTTYTTTDRPPEARPSITSLSTNNSNTSYSLLFEKSTPNTPATYNSRKRSLSPEAIPRYVNRNQHMERNGNRNQRMERDDNRNQRMERDDNRNQRIEHDSNSNRHSEYYTHNRSIQKN